MKNPVDTAALRKVVEAMVKVQGGKCHSVHQLTSMITKADRFLFPLTGYGRKHQDSFEEAMARQSEVAVSMMHEYVRVGSTNNNDDE